VERADLNAFSSVSIEASALRTTRITRSPFNDSNAGPAPAGKRQSYERPIAIGFSCSEKNRWISVRGIASRIVEDYQPK
jgi:hypothetical protein